MEQAVTSRSGMKGSPNWEGLGGGLTRRPGLATPEAWGPRQPVGLGRRAQGG